MTKRMNSAFLLATLLMATPAFARTIMPPPDMDHTPLHAAAKECDPAAARTWAANPAYRDRQDRNDQTPLTLAAENGCLEVVRLLVASGAKVDAKGEFEQTPLLQAAEQGHAKVVAYLLDQGADVNALSVGRSALVFAVMNKHLEIARLLLDQGATPDITIDGTPLVTMAIKDGLPDFAGLLIAGGAPVNAVDEEGKTPLMHACERGEPATVKALLARGADASITSKNDEAALTIAIAGEHDEIISLLLEKGATVRTEDLQAAIRARKVSLASRLIDKGADVTHGLLTALPGADLEMVRLLIRKGADLNARDYYDKTPLILEAENWSDANPEVVRHLLEHGADVNARDDKGRSALLAAAERGNAAVARILLEKGAELTLENKDGKTAWRLAAQRGDREMMALLEQAGAGRDYAGMSWEGYDAALKEQFIMVVDDRGEWERLWKRAFSKPAPAVDFENFAVACVFLGDGADWLYHIAFDEPYVKDGVMHITYRLFMNRISMEAERGFGRPSFGGQYRMEVYAKQKGVTMQIDRGKGEGDDDPLPFPPFPH